MVNDFPAYWNAPSQLLALDGCCGPVTAWGILKYFRIRASSAQIIEACRYTKRHGTFTIALAVALREFGLLVSFYSYFDPNPNRTLQFVPRGNFILPIRTRGKDMLQPSRHFFQSAAVTPAFRTSERQGYPSNLAKICFKPQNVT